MAYLRELKVTYKRVRVSDDILDMPIKSSDQLVKLFSNMQDETKEKVICVHLSNELKVLSYEIAVIGTAHKAIIDVRDIYRSAIVIGASAIILMHNHPFGSFQPSLEDKHAVTKCLKFEDLGIPLLDFIIIGEDGHYSFCDEDMLKINT